MEEHKGRVRPYAALGMSIASSPGYRSKRGFPAIARRPSCGNTCPADATPGAFLR
jgi:hypothetical protein